MHETLVHVTGVGSSAIDIGIAAGAGILGAILGASTAGGITFWMDRRQERIRARAGARLLRSDFEKAAATCGVAQAAQQWTHHLDLKIDGWDDFRDVIAARLSATEWDEVNLAVSMARNLQEAQEATRRQRGGSDVDSSPSQPLQPIGVMLMARMRQQMTKAYNVLASLAEGPEATENFGLPLSE
jgi:hypothetical protein